MMRGEKNGKSANQIKTCPPTVNPYKARATIPAIINRRLQPNGIQGLRITPANLAACFSISCLSSSFSSLEDQRLKLLDLSNRNSLLNYKFPQKGCVKLIDELPNQIFEFLSEKQAFTFIPVPEPSEKELLEQGFIIINPVTFLTF